MLESLHVKNLALIDEAEVELNKGLNILSGETGAGKSIIIGSINLALGEKVPKEMLRNPEEPAIVELIFSVERPEIKQALQDMDIEVEEDTVIMSRKLSAGRSVARINGETVPATKLKEVASLLIDIHGQHEHQSLLQKKNHLTILDAYAKDALLNKTEELKKCYKEYKRLAQELADSSLDTEAQKRELSFLQYEVQEITDAALQPGEDLLLEKKYEMLSNGKRILSAVGAAYDCTGGNGECALELTGRAVLKLQSVASYDEHLKELLEQMMEVDSLLSDVNRGLQDYLSSDELDEETFYETEKRLDLINHLKSKYGNTVDEILEKCLEKQNRITVLEDYDNYLNQLLSSVKEQEKHLDRLSREVSEIRQAESRKLCEQITEALRDLNFLDVRFEASFSRTKDYTQSGVDEVEFLISTNPGEPLKPLERVASGGELSRIMLAIKTVMADEDRISTLIFDEIDSGISGRTAQMVSQKLNQLSAKHQIICITHLPQIAAMADAHYLIEKSVCGQTTNSGIRLLDTEESVLELARMTGGVEITDRVIESAAEMKMLAQKMKQ